MTNFRIERGPFAATQIAAWAELDPLFRNWPVVYALDGSDQIYIGESLNVATRFRQHLASPEKKSFRGARVVLDPTFNKSVCLDLESFLIQRLSGDGTYQVTNRNVGISDRDYYGREEYRGCSPRSLKSCALTDSSARRCRRSRTRISSSSRRSRRCRATRKSSSSTFWRGSSTTSPPTSPARSSSRASLGLARPWSPSIS